MKENDDNGNNEENIMIMKRKWNNERKKVMK